MSRWVIVTIAIVAIVTLFLFITALTANEEALRFADSPMHIVAKNGDMGQVGAALEAGVRTAMPNRPRAGTSRPPNRS